MIRKFLFVFFVSAAVNCYSQQDISKDDTLIYFDIDWEETDIKDSAKYYRVINDYHLKKDAYKITDYFLDGKTQMTGHILAPYKQEKKTGLFIWYYHNGQKSQEASYVGGNRVGKSYYWYENGAKKEEGLSTDKGEWVEYKLESFWDSTGLQLISGGNGVYKKYVNGIIRDECTYQNGFAEGTWVGYYADGRVHFKEVFKEGEMKRGIGYDAQGKPHKYKIRFQPPVSTESDERKLTAFLRKNLVYPVSAYSNRIEGEVIVLLKIDDEGNIEAYKVKKKAHPILNAEALRVIKMYRFKPALSYGIRTSSWLEVPVGFKIEQ